MGLTHAELRRISLLAFRDWHIELADGKVTLSAGDRRIEIRAGPEQVRRIAKLELPTTAIDLHFFGCSDADVKQFMLGFDRSFHKGGG